jgi:hypothetical protein
MVYGWFEKPTVRMSKIAKRKDLSGYLLPLTNCGYGTLNFVAQWK